MARKHLLRRQTLSAALLLSALATSPTWGEDDGWIEFGDAPQQQEQGWMIPPEQFDQWVFQHASNIEGQRKEFETKLALAIDNVNDVCQLTEEQRLTLRLAGEIEINRYFAKYKQVKAYYIKTKPDQNNFNDIWQLIQPLQQIAQVGLFGEDSALVKASQEMLKGEQRSRLRELEKERRDYRYRALVEAYVMLFDDVAPLSSTQRERLVAVLLENTWPPNVFGTNDQHYIMHQSSLLSRKKIEKAVDGPLLDLVYDTFQKGKGYKSFLESQGIKPYAEEDE